MSSIVKYIVGRTYRLLLVKYLSKTRNYSYKNIRLQIPPQVFHPGFFSSTKILLRHLEDENLKGRSVLELGAGSGLLSIYAAGKGADVTATDISPVAIRCLQKNAGLNAVTLNIIASDLFTAIPQQSFDYILINPPYYKKTPTSHGDYAWYCGEEGEYFQNLFDGLMNYMHKASKVLMVLCDGCDLMMIRTIAEKNNFRLQNIYEKRNMLERNYVFKIQPVNG